MAMVLTNNMYKNEFKQRGLAPEEEIPEMPEEADFGGVCGQRLGPTEHEVTVREG